MKACPGPVELERAYWTNDELVRSHAEGCEHCRQEWTEIASLANAGRVLATPAASPERREEIRTTLLSSRPRVAPRERRRWHWPALGIPLAAAAALLLWWWSSPRVPRAPATAVSQRGSVLAHGEARYLVASFQPDEIVRLVDGTITVEVHPLQAGERFRVVTGDSEVEVKGTAFDVTAEADHLTGVRVLHGRVEVRDAGGAVMLGAGESWRAPVAAEEPEPIPTPAPAAPAPPAAPVASAPVASAPVASAPVASAPATPPPRSPGQQPFDEGWHAIRRGDFQQAAQAFEQAAVAGKGTRLEEDASYWRAVALARAGERARAAGAFEAFLGAYPSSPRAGEVSVMLGWIHFENGDTAKAAVRFRAAVGDPSERVRKSAAEGLTAIERTQQ